EDLAMNQAIGRNGAGEILGLGLRILTICNTGALATAGHGTALGIIRSLRDEGRLAHVWACETRPRQQGLKLTAYELLAEKIPFSIIADSAAATILSRGEADAVVVGADRIAANGDTANKVGTLMLAVLAKEFGVPFFVAAPSSTFDLAIADGTHIPIEERDPEEVTHAGSEAIAPVGTPVFNPAFDVTPARYIAGIVSEEGVWRP
ncbi:MAG: S-methyl-5-thioribose-1-phosphate isomerase, partial [Armatimonadota bacterium]